MRILAITLLIAISTAQIVSPTDVYTHLYRVLLESVLQLCVAILFNTETLPHANVFVRRKIVLRVLSKVKKVVNVSEI
jgi:hypothetical protein